MMIFVKRSSQTLSESQQKKLARFLVTISPPMSLKAYDDGLKRAVPVRCTVPSALFNISEVENQIIGEIEAKKSNRDILSDQKFVELLGKSLNESYLKMCRRKLKFKQTGLSARV